MRGGVTPEGAGNRTVPWGEGAVVDPASAWRQRGAGQGELRMPPERARAWGRADKS
ncbi:hypothetical protein GCM10018793_17080 [Streptomyces sulfonofaciens]|uniref:Uncharacterized protein n=1 Tax=Streptomyces sulfonofaciens TaxID=68272 RepID=A0A919G018_9ACTN|nr:hypothetical protein GCM10018793_17080 [Streptomyces sulfonofaciens]